MGMATQLAMVGNGGLIPAMMEADDPSDHEEGEISGEEEDSAGVDWARDDEDFAAAGAGRIDFLAPASTSSNGLSPSPPPRTHPHVNSGNKDDRSVQTVVKLVNNVTVGNACKSATDACDRLCDALRLLEEHHRDIEDSSIDSLRSLVTKIIEKIRIVYCVYNATGDEQKPQVLQSLTNLAKFYTEKLFTTKQLEELRTLFQSVKGTENGSTLGDEHAYRPWDEGTSLQHSDPSALASYTNYLSSSSTFAMDELPPSPTPSDEDEAARYQKPSTSQTTIALKSRDPRRGALEDNSAGKKRDLKELDPPPETSKRPKIDNATGGWLEPDFTETKSIMMKPRDPRRALSETTNQNQNSTENGIVPPEKTPVELIQKPKNTVEVPAAPTLDECLLPSVTQNGTELDMHPELQEFLKDLDEEERASFLSERKRRIEEQDKMLSEKKLCLVLDLDHTLLNSAKFMEIEQEWDQFLRTTEMIERKKDAKDGTRRELYRFPYMSMWTKLRPGIWRFLARACQLYELHLYTMGNKAYATEMAKLLDPTGVLFAGRVISKGDDGDAQYGDEKIPRSKDLDGVLGMESAVLIIDDSARVWPHHKDNLIVVERYLYFPCSRRQFGLPGPSLLEVGHDEREADGMLASILAVIERVHEEFYSRPVPKEVDTREVLSLVQRRILGGCKLVFSRIFPVEETQPQLHPLWRIAEQFGAICTTRMEEDVTHVVAISMGTDKSNWALATGKFLVRPAWVEASTVLYRRANERDFPVPP